MLYVKAMFLSGSNQYEINKAIDELKVLIANTKKDSHILIYYNNCIKELVEVMKAPNRRSQQSTPEEERRQFDKYMRAQDESAFIMEGMPKFIVSARWF